MNAKKAGRGKRRAINKTLDRRFRMRHQRPSTSVDAGQRRGKSLMDLPDTPRRRRRARGGPRRVQLGRTLKQAELASRDPVREGD